MTTFLNWLLGPMFWPVVAHILLLTMILNWLVPGACR